MSARTMSPSTLSTRPHRSHRPKRSAAVAVSAIGLLVLTACGGLDPDEAAEANNGDNNANADANAAADAGDAPASGSITSGWGPSNGQWYLYGAQSMAVVEAESGLGITVRESAGSEENAIRMDRGELDIGMLDADGAVAALGEDHDLTALFPLSVVIWQMVVGEDTDINTIADVDGARFNPGPVGGASAMVTIEVFEEALGLDVNWFDATAPDAQSAYQGRQIDGFALRGAGVQADGAVLEVDSARPVRLLSFTDEEIEAAVEVNSNLVGAMIPADTYGTDEDVQTIGYWGVLVGARGDLDSETAYEITKAFWENLEEIETTLPQVGGMTPQDAVDEALMPLHPGAVQYYEEIGITVPDDVQAPDRS